MRSGRKRRSSGSRVGILRRCSLFTVRRQASNKGSEGADDTRQSPKGLLSFTGEKGDIVNCTKFGQRILQQSSFRLQTAQLADFLISIDVV